MIMRTKAALVTGATVLALAAVGGGVAFAANSGSTPTPTPTASATSTPNQPGAAAKHHRGGLLSRVEHGEATVRTKNGDEVVDFQRGQVTAVSPTSISVRSQDGFTATYQVNGNTKVRKDKQQSAIGNVSVGDRVGVAAVHSGTDTAAWIRDAGPAKTK